MKNAVSSYSRFRCQLFIQGDWTMLSHVWKRL